MGVARGTKSAIIRRRAAESTATVEASPETLRSLAAAARDRYRTNPEIIVEALREAILRGALEGGTLLRQDELATQFGVSRIPVREALRQLSAEGLVVVKPHRGAVVAGLSADEAGEIYEIRIALETLALQLALPHITKSDLYRAGQILDELDQVTEPERWGELNREFHRVLYAPASRPRLFALIYSLRANVDRYTRIYILVMKHQLTSQREHRAILQACRRRDVAAAGAALKEHLRVASTELVEYLRGEHGGDAGSEGNHR